MKVTYGYAIGPDVPAEDRYFVDLDGGLNRQELLKECAEDFYFIEPCDHVESFPLLDLHVYRGGELVARGDVHIDFFPSFYAPAVHD